ncbi:hypothetical protein K9M78_01275 [Candidatus Bipolaricaulota bacterium]|nr:hypothetical protein [Candidatus Bipolaricaulota bacterium]
MSDELPDELSDEKIDKIRSKLVEKGAQANCPMCNNSSFQIQHLLTKLSVQSKLSEGSFRNVSLPAAVTICENCGFITLHSLTMLGLAEEFE